MKAFYNQSGVDQAIPVEILAWDGDKYVQYKDESGQVGYDKLWKFGIKTSNLWYKTPEYDWDGNVTTFTNKQVANVLKDRRKNKTEYVVWRGETKVKTFKSLQKALRFCSSSDCTALSYAASYKNGFSSGPILEKVDGFWFYFTQQWFVSEATLNRFCS